MLTLDPIVKIDLLVGTATDTASVFDVGLILGSSKTIATSERVKSYASLAEMSEDGFSQDAAEYKAAVLYFGANPAPLSLLVGVIAEGETPSQALAAVLTKTNAFYGVYVCGANQEQVVELDIALNGLNRCVQFFDVTGKPEMAVAEASLFSVLYARKSRRSLGILSTAAGDGAAVMGTAMGLSRIHTGDVFALCYKNIRGIQPYSMTQKQADAVKEKNGNIFVRRGYTRTLFENGATASGLRFDDVLYLDQIASECQEECLALIADRAAKLPQTDSTSALFLNAISRVLENYANRGVLATGIWRGNPVGTIETGEMIDKGYALHVDSYDVQNATDRAAHKAMPITCLICLAGSVESVELAVHIQQ